MTNPLTARTPRRNRHNKRSKTRGDDGRMYDSKAEADRARDLQFMQKAGVIKDLCYQARMPITIGGVDVRYPSGRHLTYVADFTYYDNEKHCKVVEDVKMQSGYLTETYRIKRALVLAMGIVIHEV